MQANRIVISSNSKILKRKMSIAIYGKRNSIPVLVFPTQDGKHLDYERFGMVKTLRNYIDKGVISLFCVDSLDEISFSDLKGDPEKRIRNQEKYYHYIVDEVVPFIHSFFLTKRKIFLTGCSMGGYHSSNFYFRRPDLFSGFLSLSGIFDAQILMGGYMSKLVYDNSPIHCLENMPFSHPYIKEYQKGVLFLCVGRGRWEEEGLRTQPVLERLLKEKKIKAFVDYWGYDVDHDWIWWKKQILYFMPMILKKLSQKGKTNPALGKRGKGCNDCFRP